MMTLEGDIVIVAGLATVLTPVEFALVRSLNVLGTTVILEPPDTASLCWGDFGIDTGIMVILVGVFAGEMGILFTGMLTLVGEAGNVAITAFPGDTMPWELMVTVLVGDILPMPCEMMLTAPETVVVVAALLDKPVSWMGTAWGWLDEGFRVMITFVTTPELLVPDNGRFNAILSLVTKATGALVCICDVIVAPPCNDASTVMDLEPLPAPSVFDDVLTGGWMMTSATEEAREFPTWCTTGLLPRGKCLFTDWGWAALDASKDEDRLLATADVLLAAAGPAEVPWMMTALIGLTLTLFPLLVPEKQLPVSSLQSSTSLGTHACRRFHFPGPLWTCMNIKVIHTMSNWRVQRWLLW